MTTQRAHRDVTGDNAGVPDPLASLTGFAGVVPGDALRLAGMLLRENACQLAAPTPSRVTEALDLYRLRLANSRITGRHHQGLEQLVSALASLDGDADVLIRHIAGDAGVVSLVTDAAGQELGLVALPRQAA